MAKNNKLPLMFTKRPRRAAPTGQDSYRQPVMIIVAEHADTNQPAPVRLTLTYAQRRAVTRDVACGERSVAPSQAALAAGIDDLQLLVLTALGPFSMKLLYRPSCNTPAMALRVSRKGRKVLPMCPESSVARLSGRALNELQRVPGIARGLSGAIDG